MYSRITLNEKESFLSNIYTFINSGVSINLALENVYKNTQNKILKNKVYIIKNKVEEGKPLNISIKEAGLFDNDIITLIKIGEEVGRLAYFFKVSATNIRRKEILDSKIKSALIYPIFVLLVSFFVSLFISLFLFPQIFKLYSDLKIPLPDLLKIFSFVSKLNKILLFLFLLGIILIFLLIFYLLFIFKKTKYIGENIIFAIPQVSSIVKYSEQAKSSLYISEMLKAGINIVDIFILLSTNTNNLHFKYFYVNVAQKLSEGKSLEYCFNTYKNNPFSYVQKSLIYSGENTGNLEKVFSKIGKNSLLLVTRQTNNLYTLLEPIMLVFIFVIVLIISVSVIYPIYNLFGQVNNNINIDNSSIIQKVVIENKVTPTSTPIPTKGSIQYVEVTNTPTGYLNIRQNPSQTANILATAIPKEQFKIVNVTTNGWYEIELNKNGFTKGFISSTYAKLLTNE